MIEIPIPGQAKLELAHLVLDYNGTLACDGRLIEGVRERLAELSDQLQVHVLTADTFGSVGEELRGIRCRLAIIEREQQDRGKLDYITRLGPEHTVCIGNGRNDRLMLQAAALGLAVVQVEGAAVAAVTAADVVAPSILDALDLLTHPLRLTATLRI